MMSTPKPITIATFYKFVPIEQPQALQQALKAEGVALGIKGTILVAHEGVNATIAGEEGAVLKMLGLVTAHAEIGGVSYQLSYADEMPFKRYFVKLKNEIVTLGMPDLNPLTTKSGTYVDPREWNTLLDDPNVLVIDVRNEYEVTLGKFKGAVNPHTESFREFPQYVQQLDPKQHPKIAMYCTGGVRCEKASALMLEKGFAEVYHLKGGILHYLAKVPAEESQWQGECFIFDDRLALDSRLHQVGE